VQAIPHLWYAHEGVPYDSDPVTRLPDLGLAHELAGNPDSAVVLYERFISTPYIHRVWMDARFLPGTLERLGGCSFGRGGLASGPRPSGAYVAERVSVLRPRRLRATGGIT
jgi:hypothetical protein